MWNICDEEGVQLWSLDSSLNICRLVGWFVEGCFLENEPAVATPQDEVEKTKDLQKEVKNGKTLTVTCMPQCLHITQHFWNGLQLWVAYHRGVKSAHVRNPSRGALVAESLADINKGDDGWRTGGPFHISQAFAPSRCRHQPQKCQSCSCKQVLWAALENQSITIKQPKTQPQNLTPVSWNNIPLETWAKVVVSFVVAIETQRLIYVALLSALSLTFCWVP